MRYSVKMIAYLLLLLGMMTFIACGGSGGEGSASGGGITPDTPAINNDEPIAELPQDPNTIALTGTTYDMQDKIQTIIRQVVNLPAKDAVPSQLNMYATFGGVQLDVDLDLGALLAKVLPQVPAMLTGIIGGKKIEEVLNLNSLMGEVMGSIKQTPLLVQFWALKHMNSSTDKGPDGTWMTEDDTIDSMYGYFDTVKNADGTYTQTTYSDFGKTKSGSIDYVVANQKKVKTFHHDAAGVLFRTTDFEYNTSGQMTKAINYTEPSGKFESVYVFTYDSEGQMTAMRSYSDEAMTKKLAGGSYTKLTWGKTAEGNKTLDLTLGLQIDFYWILDLVGWYIEPALRFPVKGTDLGFLSFSYEFHQDDPSTFVIEKETIHKMTEYAALDNKKAKITTCHIYEYKDPIAAASGGTTESGSNNYSDNEITQKSVTVNKLVVKLPL